MPAKEIVDFCNSVNEGSEPRHEIHGLSLLRIGDEKKKASGLPAVPKAFQRYLLSKSIETEIVGVGKPTVSPGDGDVKEVTVRITLKHGAKAGLLPGMRLHVIQPDGVFDTIELKKVEEQQSEGVLVRYRLKGALGLLSLLEKDPKIGWKLSTQSSYRAADYEPEQEKKEVKKRQNDLSAPRRQATENQ